MGPSTSGRLATPSSDASTTLTAPLTQLLIPRGGLGVSYSLLSKHASILEDASYLTITKEFTARAPTTRMSLTRVGREAFECHLAAMDRIVQGLT